MQSRDARIPQKVLLYPPHHTGFWDIREPSRSCAARVNLIKPRTRSESAQDAEVVQFAVQGCGDVDNEAVRKLNPFPDPANRGIDSWARWYVGFQPTLCHACQFAAWRPLPSFCR